MLCSAAVSVIMVIAHFLSWFGLGDCWKVLKALQQSLFRVVYTLSVTEPLGQSKPIPGEYRIFGWAQTGGANGPRRFIHGALSTPSTELLSLPNCYPE